MKNPWSKLSLSTDEYALCLSLVSRPDMGKMVLSEIYPDLRSEQIEERLVSASHSLMSREIIWFRDNATIALREDVERMFLPLLRYQGLVQVIINDMNMGTEIINIYLGEKNFTANRVEQGVIQHIWYGDITAIPELISGWVNAPEITTLNPDLLTNAKISLVNFGGVHNGETARVRKTLEKSGMSGALAGEMVKDLTASAKRGSAVYTKVSSDTVERTDFERADRGLVFAFGKKHFWLVQFDKVDEDSVGNLLPGTSKILNDGLKKLLY